MALREFVQVKEEFFGRAFFIPPAVMVGILFAFDGFGEVQIAAQAVGNRKIGLQDALEHLCVKLLLEILSGFQNSIGVGVLGFQIG